MRSASTKWPKNLICYSSVGRSFSGYLLGELVLGGLHIPLSDIKFNSFLAAESLYEQNQHSFGFGSLKYLDSESKRSRFLDVFREGHPAESSSNRLLNLTISWRNSFISFAGCCYHQPLHLLSAILTRSACQSCHNETKNLQPSVNYRYISCQRWISCWLKGPASCHWSIALVLHTIFFV